MLEHRLNPDLAAQREVLDAIAPQVRALMERHRQSRKLWMPSELLPASEHTDANHEAELREIRSRARGLPDSVRVALALNLLTEEGLPHFHRLVAQYLGHDGVWAEWNNLWTAEEDRHGCVLRDYVRDARLFDMRALEHLQYQYLEAGFNPDWRADPYRLLAYTSLQEKATQTAHANAGRIAGQYEPKLQKILAHICADEARHYAFYRDTFALVLKADTNRALAALAAVAPSLAMPGHTIAGYAQMSEVERRAGIYGPREYLKLVEDLVKHWAIDALDGLSAVGRAAQEKIMQLPARLARMADYIESKAHTRSFSFDFIYQRAFEMAAGTAR
ncbi:acyl-[acyl-carrier-protein] desaturase [Fontimonas thermophila]|uniref:Acyl-[acyl-carrier-protein] desaturase n=1 Tax=Fontimonas thermophila TaxID=1076937 RepID=A0A1I2JUT8_9GAMM|nr:acyl-ACP desaturase [Fontimonas thermophila]SFF57823.1 acyl-[acyl-carrier-protein] desaturase [Fontimonas thermophila]